jgi:CPA1 family monovalent cation:H+ antiporter
MEFTAHDQLLLLGLLAAVALLVSLPPFLRVPYPILLVLGGLALSFVPGIPHVVLPPSLVLVIALPPLLYSAAFYASLRDLRANIRPITLLAVGLVVATMVTVAVVAHVVIGISWAAAFVLGAIVSPTDPVAATAIASRLGVPRRVTTIVEGESMVNDGTALVAYKFAVAAVVSGSFSAWDVPWRFLADAAGGIAIGIGVGIVVAAIRRRLDWTPAELTLSLMTSYFAYLPASAAGLSGVLAVVAAALWLGWRAPQLTTPATRMQGTAVWDILVFVLNSLLFVLVGLQLSTIVDRLQSVPTAKLIGYGALVSAVVISTRLAFVYPFTYGPKRFKRIREYDWNPSRGATFLVAWTGMRGAVSLAAALALPLATDAGARFPGRELIIFLTFCVILVTLVLQGLTLPVIIRRLRIPDDGKAEREEAKARVKAAEAALARLEELQLEDWVRDQTAERLRGLYDYRRRRFGARLEGMDEDGVEQQSQDYQRLRRELLEAERRAVVGLRNEGWINDEVMHRVERDLDLEDQRLDVESA